MKKTIKQSESETELSILKIAMLISALDGHVDDVEYDVFQQLLASCRFVSSVKVLDVFSETKRIAMKLAHLANNGNEDVLLDEFMRQVDSFCVWKSFVMNEVLMHQAIAMWTAMALADMDYCSVERKAIRLLQERINAIPRISDDFLIMSERTILRLKKLRSRFDKAVTPESKLKIKSESERLLNRLQGVL